MNFGLKAISDDIELLHLSSMSLPGNKVSIMTIPDNIIDKLSTLQLPTIHHVLEVILFYLCYHSRSSEIDSLFYSYLQDEYTDDTIINICKIVEQNALVLALEVFIGGDDNYDFLEYNVLFCGWTIDKKSYSFFDNYDIILKSEKLNNNNTRERVHE